MVDPVAGLATAAARVARSDSSSIDNGAPSCGKVTTSLPGGVVPSARNPAFANVLSCSGLRMNRANSLAALTCSLDSHFPDSSTVG